MSYTPSERCEAFLRHWESLRGGELIPALKDFLARPNPDLQPHVMITDFVSRTEMPIRLFGTSLVNLVRADQTKRDFMHAFATPGMSDLFSQVAELIVDVPCGAATAKAGITAKGQTARLDMISLPARPYPNAPRCLVSFVVCATDLDPDDYIYQVGEYLGATWVDLGAGVPDLALSTDPDKDRPDLVSKRDLFRTFSDHWFFLKGEQDVVRMSDFLNRPIPVLQPHVTILDVEAPDRIMVRLAGTALNESYGTDITGQNMLDSMSDHLRQPFHNLLSTMVETPCGADVGGQVYSSANLPRSFRHLGFPLKRNDNTVNSTVWFNQQVPSGPEGSAGGQGVSALELDHWIDIGFGVPPVP